MVASAFKNWNLVKMKEEVRGAIDARRLRMRKNPVYILQNCARVVRSARCPSYVSYSSTDVHILWHSVIIDKCSMWHIYIEPHFAVLRPICEILNLWTGSIFLLLIFHVLVYDVCTVDL